MSQEKVDRYKKEKINRKKNMKKEKVKNFIHKCVVGVIALALIGWIGYSAYGTYEASRPKEKAEIDYTAVNELAQELAGAAETESE